MDSGGSETPNCFEKKQTPLACLYFHEDREDPSSLPQNDTENEITNDALRKYSSEIGDAYFDKKKHGNLHYDDKAADVTKKFLPIISLPGDIEEYRNAPITASCNHFLLSHTRRNYAKEQSYPDTLNTRDKSYDRPESRVGDKMDIGERFEAVIFDERDIPRNLRAWPTCSFDERDAGEECVNTVATDFQNFDVLTLSVNKGVSLGSNESGASNLTNVSRQLVSSPVNSQNWRSVSKLSNEDLSSRSSSVRSGEYNFYIVQKRPSGREKPTFRVYGKDRVISFRDEG